MWDEAGLDREQPAGCCVTPRVGGLHLILVKANDLSHIVEALSMPQWLLEADVNPLPHRGVKHVARPRTTLTKTLL
jgi:hypothetical protein